MKKIILFIIIYFSFFSLANAGSFLYPFSQISDPKCRFSSRNTLGSDCKIDLPRIEKGDYTKYKSDSKYRRIYSILWGSTYDYGWDVGYGSHLGIDIATSLGTPVRAIGDGEVITASWLAGRGNTVVIKHKLIDGKYVYSNYAHLNKISAIKGSIKAGDIIGEVGATGNAYGNHLHFQLDITNQAHPYWYTTCSKGIDIFSVVNNGICRDFLTVNTIDPILFLESNGTYIATIDSIQRKQEETKKIEQKNIKTREQILEEEINEFLRAHSIKLSVGVSGNNLMIGKTYLSKLEVNYFNRPFTGILPGTGVEFEYDKKALKIFPEKIIAIEKGLREVKISPLKSGKTNIKLKLGKKIIGSVDINAYKDKELSSPTDALFLTPKNMALGDEKMSALVFKTRFGSNQIRIPYDGKYVLKSLSGKVKFCNVSNKAVKKCNGSELVEELSFSYQDTKYGVLIFNMIALDYAPIKLNLRKVGYKNDISRTKYQITISNPLQLDKSYTYYDENISALKKGLLRLNSGYLLQDRELFGKQVKEIIINYLSYQYLASGNNLAKKKTITEQIRKTKESLSYIDDYKKFSRVAFAKFIFDNLGLSTINNSDKVFIDETGDYKDYITTLREKYDFKWKDQFGDRYFQADKNITIGEALYLVEKISKG